MHFKTSLFLLAGVSAVLASPLQRRQETTTTAAAESTTAAAGLPTPSPADPTAVSTSTALTVSGTETTALSSIESGLTSLASSLESAAATTTALAPTDTSGEFNGTCPEGYSLTYAISVVEYPDIELAQARDTLSNWGPAIPPPIESVSAEGEGVGATRSWTLNNISVSETLVNQTENAETGSLIQNWNTSAPINVSTSLIIASASTSLTLYSNETSNATSVSFFVNFCASEQQAGLALYSQVITAYLTGLNSLFLNSTQSTGAGAATTALSSAASATDAASSAAASATSGAAGITGSAASGISSVAGQVTSAPASAISSIAGQLTSGGIGAASSAIGGLTSGLGAITGGL